MKPQDIVFFAVLILLLSLRKPRLLVWAGLSCLVAAAPLFARWVFFTAERLTWYAALLFCLFLLTQLFQLPKKS